MASDRRKWRSKWRRVLFAPSQLLCVAILTVVIAGSVYGTVPPVQKPAQKLAPTYEFDIRPILAARCAVCHNAESVSSASVSGGLDLSTYAAIQTGVHSTSINVQGAKSILLGGTKCSLLERLSVTSPIKMMPRGGPPLSGDQFSLFSRWIAAGAPRGASTSASTTVPAVSVGNSSSNSNAMPAVLGIESVLVHTNIRPQPALLPTPPPKDTLLTYGLKVGPLPALTSIAYSPNGELLAVGGYRAVTFWNTKTGKPAGCITHLRGPVQSMVFNPSGDRLAAAGGQAGAPGELTIIDTKSLSTTPISLSIADVILAAAWSPDGSRIALGNQDKSVRVIEYPTGKELRVFKDNGDSVTSVCFAPDGKSLYSGGMDHLIRRYDLEKGALIRSFTGHNEGINAIAISLDGKRLVSSGSEPNLRWWNTDTGDLTNNNGGHGGQVNALCMSKDGKIVVSASADKTVKVWDAGSTGQQRSLDGSIDWVYAATLSPDSKFTAAAGADGLVRIWETATGRLRLTLAAWPQEKNATLPEWISLTPEGYFDGSADWCSRLKPTFGVAEVAKPTIPLADWVKTLRLPENVLKSWLGQPLDVATPKPK